MTYYEDLLEVSIRNTTFMFDLDDETGKPREVNFIEGTDHLLKLNGFVNQGTSHLMVTTTKKG